MAASRDPRRSILRRRRDAGHHPAPFRGRQTKGWLLGGTAGLLLLAVAPLLSPTWYPWTGRAGTLLALVFLLASGGLWLGMRGRAFVVAVAAVALLYAVSAAGAVAWDVHDVFVLAVLAGFAIFALAGFNLVFVLEEVVFDLHRVLHLRHRAWAAVPAVTVGGLSVLLPVWEHAWGGPHLGALWGASVAATFVLGGWWFLRAFNNLPEHAVLPELHLFAFGIVGAAGLVEAVSHLGAVEGLLPSIAAYIVLVGTWVYVTYTTLQRTHFLLGGRNTLPWVSLLLSASYAILVHIQAQYSIVPDPDNSLATIVRLRVAYMVVGVWVGIAFYVLRSSWRLLRTVRHWAVLGRRGRMAAGSAARLAEGVLRTEQRLGTALGNILWGLESAIPGSHAQRPSGWDLDASGITPIRDEEE